MPDPIRRLDAPRSTDDAPHAAQARPPARPTPAVDGVGGALAVAYARQRLAVAYLGMNAASADREATALSATGAAVTRIESTPGDGSVVLDGRTHDLATAAGARAFVGALAARTALGPAERLALERAFAAGEGDDALVGARDELARLAIAWATAGSATPPRWVLSGHSLGADVHGEDALPFRSIRELGRAFPSAAAAIESLHFAGCFTGGQIDALDAWREVFPNLQSAWGYAGFSPEAPVHHLAAWEGATRAGSHRFGVMPQGVVTWSANDGVRDAAASADLAAGRWFADHHYPSLFAGERRVETPSDPVAMRAYAFYRRISTRADVTPEGRALAKARADELLRIRFYQSSVRRAFAERYAEELASGYRSVGHAPPELARMSRRDALAETARFRALAEGTPPGSAARAAYARLTALAELDPRVVLARWCR